MRDNQDCAGVVHEISLEPLDALEIQVVGRLVEQNQIGLFQQKFAEKHTGLLTAGERGEGPRCIGLAEAETPDDAGHAASRRIAVHQLIAVLGLGVGGEQFFERGPLGVLHLPLHERQLCLEIQNRLNDFGQLLLDGELGVERVVLVEIAHGSSLFQGNFALVPRQLPGQQI